MKAHDKLRNIADLVVSPRIFAIGIMAKDPVTSSRFSNRIITKPVGKIMAPTISSPVCVAAVKAKVVANPRKRSEERRVGKEGRTRWATDENMKQKWR